MPLITTPRDLTLRSELYHQFGAMTAAGMTLPQAIDALKRNPPKRAFRAPLEQLSYFISQGETFTGAMQRLNKWMPDFDIALIEAGEKSGRLPQCFQLLSDHYRDRAKLIMTFMMGIAYPVFILHFALLVFPLNLLVNIFKDGALTPFLLEKAAVYGGFWVGIFLFAYACQGKHGEKWRSFLESITQLVPVLGTAQRYLALARLAAALEALIMSGITIIEAWQMASVACGSPAIRRTVATWLPQLTNGQTPAELLSNSTIFPELFANMYHSGEISGKLDETLMRLNQLYQEDGSRKLKAFMVVVGIVITLSIMLGVAFNIIMFYVGYFKKIGELSE